MAALRDQRKESTPGNRDRPSGSTAAWGIGACPALKVSSLQFLIAADLTLARRSTSNMEAHVTPSERNT